MRREVAEPEEGQIGRLIGDVSVCERVCAYSKAHIGDDAVVLHNQLCQCSVHMSSRPTPC